MTHDLNFKEIKDIATATSFGEVCDMIVKNEEARVHNAFVRANRREKERIPEAFLP